MIQKFQKEKEAFEKEDGKPLSSLQPVAVPARAVDSSLSVSDPLLSLIGCANESDLLHAASTIDLGDIDLEKLLYDSPAASPLDLDEGSDPLTGGPGQVLKQSPVLPEGLPGPLERRIKELTQISLAGLATGTPGGFGLNCREFLCNVVRIKMGSYELERNKSQSAEEYLKAFLEAEVKPLWPKGWMQARMLFKESRRVHSYITSIPTKKKVINPSKIKMKDPFVKLMGSMSTSQLHSGGPAVLAQGPGSNALSPVGFFVPASTTAHSSSIPSVPHSFTRDDSLDEDLIHNPPSLEGTLAPGTLSILPGIVPVHTFSFPVLSFGSDSKAGGSKDAVVTGPAPGTFHHGLAHI
ncbi:UNVERIFIED_CONTAM: hypothetical protein FKN15_059730 [Acipenser sinensis]